MAEEQVGSLEDKGYHADMHQGGLQEAVKILRARLASIRVRAWVEEEGIGLGVCFEGCESDLEDRRLLARNLAHCLPAALSVIGVQPQLAQEDEMKQTAVMSEEVIDGGKS